MHRGFWIDLFEHSLELYSANNQATVLLYANNQTTILLCPILNLLSDHSLAHTQSSFSFSVPLASLFGCLFFTYRLRRTMNTSCLLALYLQTKNLLRCLVPCFSPTDLEGRRILVACFLFTCRLRRGKEGQWVKKSVTSFTGTMEEVTLNFIT